MMRGMILRTIRMCGMIIDLTDLYELKGLRRIITSHKEKK